jgi:hypothetical protein
MLFKQNHLAGIKDGTISVAFRKWKKPAAKIGSKIKTAIGLIEILDVETVAENKITRKDAASAGFDTVENLRGTWKEISDGQIYKITLRYYSVDPRIALRSQNDLTASELETLKKKLEKLDTLSKTGPWTTTVLNAINDHPRLRAADLAKSLGLEKLPFKINVRKLKNLGLTISEEVGYTISPLGKWILEKIKP